MKQHFAPHAVAGWLHFVPAAMVTGIWCIYLFVATPENMAVWESAAEQLRFTFSNENEYAWQFAWLAALPVLCVLLGLAYLSKFSRGRTASLVLFALSVALAGATFILNDWSFAACVSLPAVWGYRATKSAA